MDTAPDWYSASVPGIINATSYYIGPHYKSTQLYTSTAHFFLIAKNVTAIESHTYVHTIHIQYNIAQHLVP